MTLIEFINQYYDQPNTGDTPQNLGQCVGLVERWIDALSLPHVWGNAKDLLANADSNSYDIIYNTPEGKPSFGDIFCFGSNYGGGVGHTGIVAAASTNIVTLFEQNDGLNGGTPQFKTYIYGTSENDALGWLHPKGVVVDQQSLIDALRNQRDANYNLYKEEQQKNTDLQTQLADCQSEKVTPTEVPVTTNEGSTIVNVSTTPPESATSTIPTENPTIAVQTALENKPVTKPMRKSDLIVWVLLNIKSVLSYWWKNFKGK